MYVFVITLYVLVSLGIILLVMLQKGSGSGASMGLGGGSGTVFGSSGSNSFLVKMTGALAVVFFILSVVIGNMNAHQADQGTKWSNIGKTTVQSKK